MDWHGQTVHTGIWKQPVEGPRQVRRLNIDGDGQGDLAGHGGEHRAVFVYQIESYRYWQEQLGRDDFSYGQFGENFTISGLADDQVCIGDRYQIGEALFEVTQPRVTCYRVGIRMNEARMPALLVSHHRPGFYFRVLREGAVQAGDEIVQVTAGPEAMTVAEIDGLLYLPGHLRDRVLSALHIPALPDGWKASFRAMASQAEAPAGAAGTTLAPGNAGLTAVSPPPAWPGFRPLTVTALDLVGQGEAGRLRHRQPGAVVAADQPGLGLGAAAQQGPQRGADLRFHYSGLSVRLVDRGEHAAGLGVGAGCTEPARAVPRDEREVGQGLHVLHQGRRAIQATLAHPRRLERGQSGTAAEPVHQRRFLARQKPRRRLRDRLTEQQQRSHQRNLLLARATGGPPWLSPPDVRAIITVRLLTFLSGDAAVSAGLCQRLADFLNDGIVPAVPRAGAAAAGEIIQLAHAFGPVVGIGQVLGPGGALMPAREALSSQGLTEFSLGPKEGIALIQGVPGATGLCVLRLGEAAALTSLMEAAAALSIVVARAPRDPYRAACGRGDDLLAAVLGRLREAAGDDPSPRSLQAPVSFRVAGPVLTQVHRAAAQLEAAARRALTGVTDSPAYLDGRFISTAGFHGIDLSAHCDLLTAALCHAAEVAAARLHRLMDPAVTGLPAQLAREPGPRPA